MRTSIDDTIEKVEVLYRSITGFEPPPPNGAYAPVPPEADPLEHVEAQLARLAELVAHPEPLAAPTWNPPMALWEEENELVAQLDVAGVAQGDVDVSTTQQLVTITGSRSEPSAERVWLNEQGVGPFSRSILLPANFDPETMRVTAEQGMLQLRFAKHGKAQSKTRGKAAAKSKSSH